MEKIIIDAQLLREKIGETKCWVVWDGSVQDKWNKLCFELDKFMKEPFFLLSVNDYNKECGWYLKFSELYLILKDIYKKILNESSYTDKSFLFNNYNKIISIVNSQIPDEYRIKEFKKCSNKKCIFSVDDTCCNEFQNEVVSNCENCKKQIRSDYYEYCKKLRDKINNKIKYMSLEELENILKLMKEV